MKTLLTLLLLSGCLIPLILCQQMFYPWARSHNRNFHFEERQNDILNSLRNELRLEVLTEKLPVGMDDEHSMYIRNSEGQKYTCGVHGKESPTTSLATTSSSEDKAMTSYQKAFGVIDRLQKVCIINSIDWWSYEWCHRQEVKQFHLAVDADTKRHVRNPEWSLGTYVYSDYYSHEFDEDTVEEVIDYYEDGQVCDETGEGRKTEVHLRCCSDDAAVRTYRNADGIPPEKIISFQKYRETKTCSYQIDLCTPLLCDEIQHADHPEKLKTLSLLDFMAQFRHVCMKRQENWWSYEVCFGGDEEPEEHEGTEGESEEESTSSGEKTLSKKEKRQQKLDKQKKTSVVMSKKHAEKATKTKGIRQFHVETVMTKTEKENEVLQHQVIQAEFLLGTPPLVMYTNATALTAATRYPLKTSATMDEIHTSQPKVPSLHLEFSHGEKCDIEDVRRGVTVEVSCGERDGIEDIIEDRTCHYVIKMTSKLLCRVDGFSPPKKEISEILCYPEGESGKKSNRLDIEDSENSIREGSREREGNVGDSEKDTEEAQLHTVGEKDNGDVVERKKATQVEVNLAGGVVHESNSDDDNNDA